jgi:CO/xanthine dehydrogenase Mo-binding subunit
MMGTAVTYAAEDIRKQLADLAADLLEAAPEDIVVEDGRAFVAGSPASGLDYSSIIRKSRQGNVLGNGTFRTEGELNAETGLGVATCHMHQCTAAAQVEVDTETGRVTVEHLHVATYAGKVINPTLAELQMDGNMSFGLGQALMEEMIYDSGALANPNMSDYLVPSFRDLPASLDSSLLADPNGLAEPHGLGEGTTAPVPAAIGNAVFDAIGVRIRELPITPERVLRALRERAAADG